MKEIAKYLHFDFRAVIHEVLHSRSFQWKADGA